MPTALPDREEATEMIHTALEGVMEEVQIHTKWTEDHEVDGVNLHESLLPLEDAPQLLKVRSRFRSESERALNGT